MFITRADFAVVHRWNIPRLDISPYAVPVSGAYDIDLSDGTATIGLAHALEPHGVDRVEFRVGCSSTDPDDRYPFKGIFLFLVQIDLSYNQDRSVLTLPLILLHLPAPRDFHGMTAGPPMARDKVERNRQTAREVLAAITDDIVREPGVLDEVQTWADVDVDSLIGLEPG